MPTVPPPITVRRLSLAADLDAAFPLVARLRPRLSADTFVADVRSQMAAGYVLLGAFAGPAAELVALAGVRPARTLSRGPHLFVDDLITADAVQGRGYGTAMLRAVAAMAADLGLPAVHLDSRETARGFYGRLGFQFSTATPCGIATTELLG